MRIVHIALVVCLLLAVASASMAATGQQNVNVGTRLGPRLATQAYPSAYVLVNGKRVMHIPAQAGGFTPMERAREIAGRLKSAFGAGYSWSSMRIAQVCGIWCVAIDGRMIATADSNSACALRISTGMLASKWARQTVVALGGKPQMIASRLSPARQMVAGAKMEAGVCPPKEAPCPPKAITWMTSPTKTVLLINAATGEEMGSVVVAGDQGQLNLVSAVAVYASLSSDQNIYTFVPMTSASMASQPVRVQGVGLVSIPSGMVSMSGVLTGDDAAGKVGEYASKWNSMINANLKSCDIRLLNGTAKVVPLYSTDMNQVIGAAQVMGSTSAIANVKAVLVSMSDDTVSFRATSTACTPLGSSPEILDNVVLSSIIVVPYPGAMAPTEPAPMPENVNPPCPPEAPACPTSPPAEGTCPPSGGTCPAP